MRMKRLQWLLLAAIVALMLQLNPPLYAALVWAVDMRNWTQLTWLLVTGLALAALLAIRLWPEPE